jgi:type II secretory pathway pseudopilin PulG
MPRAPRAGTLGWREDRADMRFARSRVSGLLTLPGVKPALRSCRGGLLVDSVIAMAVFVVAGSAVLSGVSTVQRSGAVTESQAIAERVARNQMESILSQAYLAPPASFSAVPAPVGFSVTASGQEYVVGDTDIEKVSVSVSQGGTTVLVIETLRTRD